MKKLISTDKSPSPIGAYSQATLINGLLFVSGQIAIDPKNGKLMLEDISVEAKQVMENIKGVLEKADMGFNDIVKASIFLADMSDFSKVDKIFGAYFDNKMFPAREAVEVARLPKDVNVEISVIAIKEDQSR